MVNLYKSTKYFNKNEIMDNPEMFFINRISSKDLSDDSIKVMHTIDKAVLLDKSTGKIQTPFGICSIEDLSTGCKIAICIIYLNEHRDRFSQIKAVNATEAGVNALDSLFDYIEKNNFNIGIITEQEDIFDCKDRIYKINGKYMVDSLLTMHKVGD